MISLSDNVTHLIQLALMLGVMCVLIIFAPSIPPLAVFAAFVPTASALLGAKINQSATNAANAVSETPAAIPAIVPPQPPKG